MRALATAERFLDRFEVILLDMNSTFMFGEDRFGDDEDYFATYERLGGLRLDRSAVNSAVRRCFEGMLREYRNPSEVDDFPSLAEGFQRYAASDDLDLPMLEAVFAHHELGHISEEYAACLERLSQSHQLGLVSNIWARKEPWLAEFERAGVGGIWRTMVFSSDGRSIKPSHKLFRKAVSAFNVPSSLIVFVGDSLRVDVSPAKCCGLGTVWIASETDAHPLADCVVPSLLELAALPASPTFHAGEKTR